MNFFKKNKIFIIGEIGLNHDGSKKKCKLLIKKASDAKFDAVKLQISIPEESYDKNTKSYKFFLKYNLSVNDLKEVKKYAKEKKIILFTTVGDIESIKYVKLLKSKIIKISSGLLTNYPLIKKLAQLNLPMIISSGLAFKTDINEAVKLIRKYNNKQLGILVCTSIYPTTDKQVKIDAISKFKKIFKKNFIGYSDHSKDNLSAYISAGVGAQIIEKHITIKRKKLGDHKFSLESHKFKEFIQNIRRIELMNQKKNLPLKKEIALRKSIYRFIVAKKNIDVGEKINLNNIGLKRTLDKSEGINNKYFEKIIGKVTKQKIKKDTKIKRKQLIL